MASTSIPGNDEMEVNIRTWIGFLGMVLGVFMSVGDIQIVASSIEQIQAGLSSSPDEIAWVQSAYLIAEVIVIPLSGWLGKALSMRGLYTLSFAGFTLMSLACAFSWNLPSMVAFRALQGLFGGVTIPILFSAIYIMFPPRLQATASVLVGLVVTLAPVTGPVFGGYLTAAVSWKAMFLINIIPGILVCLTTWAFVRVDEPQLGLLSNIDYPGIAYIFLFLGSMQYVLEEGAREDWFESRQILFFSLLACAGAIGLLHRELTISQPVVDLRAFLDFNFSLGCLFSFLLGGALCSIIYLMPVYLSSVKGLNSLQIGQYVMVTGIFQFLSAFLAGALSRRMDPRLMLGLGMFLLGLGSWLNGGLTAEDGYWEFFVPQALRGTALMFCFLPINTLLLGSLPPNQVKNASSLYNLIRNVGGAMGIAWANTSIAQWGRNHYSTLREHATAADWFEMDNSALADIHGSILASPDGPTAALQLLHHLVQREAQVLTFNDLFHCIGLIACASALLTPLLKKPNAHGSWAEEAH